MSEARADSAAPGPDGWRRRPDDRAGGWSRRKWLMFVALVFAAQVTLIFVLGEKQFPPTRAVTNVPHLTLADGSSELMALDDPTLFVLPHPNDFATAVWSQMTPVPQPSFRWTEPPRPLPLAAESLGAVFTSFMQTNPFIQFQLDFKPPVNLSEPALLLKPVFAETSTLQIQGELAQRKLLDPVSLPSWPYANVIAPSRVQVLVDAAGNVVSAVLLPPANPGDAASQFATADQRALELARRLRFEPAPRLTVGQMNFDWRTVAPPATNSPAAVP